MSRLFTRMAKKYVPPMSDIVMNGYASHCMEHFVPHLDSQIRSIAKSFPSCITYDGYERCTTQEEYEEVTKAHSAIRKFNIAESTIYMLRFKFTFTDANQKKHQINRCVYVPYAREGGIVRISGVDYHLTPVISDKVFTPSGNRLFVRLTRDRNNIFREYHPVVLNGVRELQYVPWSQIHRKESESRVEATTKAQTTLVHYLLTQYGFTGMFKRYAGVVPVIGEDNITPEAYPPEEWIICSSAFTKGIGPTTYIQKSYEHSKLKLAVKKKDWNKQMEGLVYGFFYIVDHFPERVKNNHRYYDSTEMWTILLGHILWSGFYAESKLFKDVLNHLDSIRDNLDTDVKQKLHQLGIDLENFFDLLNFLVVNTDELLSKTENAQSLYGKNLEILHYVAYPIVECFVKLNFALNKLEKSQQEKGHLISLAEISKNISQRIRLGAIFKLSGSDIVVAETVAYPGDHKYPKITSILLEQESARRTSQSRSTVTSSDRLEPSSIVLGSILNFPKSDPRPSRRINPWAMIDPKTGTILENPRLTELMAALKPCLEIS